MTTHLGSPGYRSACGRTVNRLTVRYSRVTCWSCRRSRKFKERLYGPNPDPDRVRINEAYAAMRVRLILLCMLRKQCINHHLPGVCPYAKEA